MIGGYQVQYKEKKMAQRLIHYLLGEIFSEVHNTIIDIEHLCTNKPFLPFQFPARHILQ